jgi:hypothetical protein
MKQVWSIPFAIAGFMCVITSCIMLWCVSIITSQSLGFLGWTGIAMAVFCMGVGAYIIYDELKARADEVQRVQQSMGGL